MKNEVFEAVKGSRIRTKINVEVDMILHDGTRLHGGVFIGLDERVQDLLNDPKPFLPVRLDTGEVLLVNKAMLALVKPLDVAG